MTFVIVIEQKPLLRLGIMHLLSKVNVPLNLAGYDPVQLVKHVPTQSCDLAIVSVSGSDDIFQLTQNVERICSPRSILLLYDSIEIPSTPHTISSHIVGCVYKHATPEILLASMQLVLAGGTCFPTSSWSEHTQIPLSLVPDAEKPLTFSGDPANDGPIHPTATSSSHRQIQKYTRRATDKSTSTSTYPSNSTCGESEMLGLTPRQYEVLVLLAKGYPMKTVGRQLNISVATAKAHTESLYQRLDVRNRNAAVYAAINRGATLGWECIPNQFQAGAPS